MTLAESPNPVASGQPVTFTATVSPSGGSLDIRTSQNPNCNLKTAGNCATGSSSSTFTCTWTPPSSGSWYASAVYGVSPYQPVPSNEPSFTVGSASSGPQCSATLPSGTVVGMADTPDAKGYWIASSNGQVSACGDAAAFGGVAAPPSPIAAIAAAPSGSGGYWLVSQNGPVYAFGSAVSHGGANNLHLNAPIVAMAADPATGGYWLLGADGGVFSFDAPFFGSTGNIHLNKPAVGMEATPHGNGYRFVASDQTAGS